MGIKSSFLSGVEFAYDTVRGVYVRLRLSVGLFVRRDMFIMGNSCYPDKIRKSNIRIAWEQLIHVWRCGEINEFYFIYGQDVVSCDYADKILDYNTFSTTRNRLNNCAEISYINILRDKMLFGIYASALGIRTPSNIGVVEQGQIFLFDSKQNITLFEFIRGITDLNCVVKVIDGECGKGVYMVRISNGDIWVDNQKVTKEQFYSIFINGSRYLIQERVLQHECVNKLYPLSVNTLRLVTLRRNGEIVVLPTVLRVGAGGSIVDNWSQGGIAIGVNLVTGTLKRNGVYRPEYSKITTIHPDSGVVFEGFQLPSFDQAIAMAVRFHTLIPNIDSVGWDIAFTPEGPCFIEGNDNWEVSLNQACNIDEIGLFKRYLSSVRI